MKICVTGLRGIPNIQGGVETHCEQLLPRIKSLRPSYEIEVIGRQSYVGKDPYTYEGIRISPLPMFNSKHLEAATNTMLAMVHARFSAKADLLHVHAIGPALFIPIAKVLGLPIVFTHHGKDYDRQKWNGPSKAVLRLGERLGILFSDKVISVSRTLAEDLKSRFPRQAGKIRYIPNGATVLPPVGAEGAAEVLDRLGLTPRGYVLGVGRLVPEKGFHDLVEAFLRSRAPGKLVIAGRADHEDDYSRKLIARGGERILFAGFQDRAAMRVLLENAGLFVLPSYHEGLPIAALEAANADAPMLLSDIVANRDVGLPAGNYFPVGNVDALVQALERDWTGFSIDSAPIRREFDWAQIAEAVGVVYDQFVP